MALTSESIDLALAQLDGEDSGIGTAVDIGSNADTSSIELARLFRVVDIANSGSYSTQTEAEAPLYAVRGKGADWIVEKLGELIAKLRSAFVTFVKTIAGAISFSIGLTGPLLTVSVNFGS